MMSWILVKPWGARWWASVMARSGSAHPYLLAVVVPTEEALDRYQLDELNPPIADSLQNVAKEAGLQSYEVPRDFLIETTPFSLENGLLTGIRKLALPKLKQHYGERLEQLYAELAQGQANELSELRRNGADAPVLQTVSRAAAGMLGTATTDLSPDAHFTDLGGDSLSALTFGTLLREIFDIDVPVGVIVSPPTDLQSIAGYIDAERTLGSKRCVLASVHGPDATQLHASDLTLDKFIDATTLAAVPNLPEHGRGTHGAVDRRDRLPGPLPGIGMARADGHCGRQADLPGACQRRCRSTRTPG
jgi:fatty acid CoA ligase FadD9